MPFTSEGRGENTEGGKTCIYMMSDYILPCAFCFTKYINFYLFLSVIITTTVSIPIFKPVTITTLRHKLLLRTSYYTIYL